MQHTSILATSSIPGSSIIVIINIVEELDNFLRVKLPPLDGGVLFICYLMKTRDDYFSERCCCVLVVVNIIKHRILPVDIYEKRTRPPTRVDEDKKKRENKTENKKLHII